MVVVGYSTRSMPGAIRLLGVPFQETSGNFNINAIIPYHSEIEINWSAPAVDRPASYQPYAPQIQIQKTDGGYDTYYYVQNARYRNDAGQVAYKPGWCSTSGAFADTANSAQLPGMVTPGASVWFKDTTNDTPVVQTSGQVINQDVEINCPTGFRCRAPAFPKEFFINGDDVTYTGIDSSISINWSAPAVDRPASYQPYAPQIQIQKADGGYDTYYYVQNARYRNEAGQVAYKPGWCSTSGAFADLANSAQLPGKVDVNWAFWTKGVGAPFTMKFIAQ